MRILGLVFSYIVHINSNTNGDRKLQCPSCGYDGSMTGGWKL
jgi:hypothetical protein